MTALPQDAPMALLDDGVLTERVDDTFLLLLADEFSIATCRYSAEQWHPLGDCQGGAGNTCTARASLGAVRELWPYVRLLADGVAAAVDEAPRLATDPPVYTSGLRVGDEVDRGQLGSVILGARKEAQELPGHVQEAVRAAVHAMNFLPSVAVSPAKIRAWRQRCAQAAAALSRVVHEPELGLVCGIVGAGVELDTARAAVEAALHD